MTTPPLHSGRRLGRTTTRRAAEAVARAVIYLCGWLAIVILGAIAAFLVWNSLRAINEAGLGTMLTGSAWYPTSDPGKFPDCLKGEFIRFCLLEMLVELSLAYRIECFI